MNLIKTSLLAFTLSLNLFGLGSERTDTPSPSPQAVFRSIASIASMAGFRLDPVTYTSIQAASDFLVKPVSRSESPEMRLARTAVMYYEYELRHQAERDLVSPDSGSPRG